MTPLVAIVAGLAAIALGTLLLRAYGPRLRVGRLLAVTPAVTIAQARALAARGGRPYVRVEGRVDADEDFPDEHARPLVFRRRRLEVRAGRAWRAVDDRREHVPFRVREGLEAIDVDVDALDLGLVTLVRESTGTAAEVAAALGDAAVAGVPAATPARLRVEQLSAVEHATVLGVPVAGADGRVAMTAGAGRPLVVSVLERDEAMRVLAEGRRARPIAAAVALSAGLALLGLGLAWALLAGGIG
ncbi:MAG: hypothetical protein M0T75_04150 [Chloroflexi bacterium]|nr:hypothetical protein [Chloroflexota bacterium]